MGGLTISSNCQYLLHTNSLNKNHFQLILMGTHTFSTYSTSAKQLTIYCCSYNTRKHLVVRIKIVAYGCGHQGFIQDFLLGGGEKYL